MAVGLAGVLLILWLALDPRAPDLAAQVYRLSLYERAGFGVFDERWYAGHGLPGYSLLFAPLASLTGIRVLAVLAVLGSVALFERLALRVYGRGRAVRLGTCVFAVAAVGDVWSGRVTFALGVTFALACAYALSRKRLLWAALLAAVCSAASPVAGVLMALAALTYALAFRSPRTLPAVVGPVVLVLVPVRLLFPEGGFEPYPARSFIVTVLAIVMFLWALPREDGGGGGGRLRSLLGDGRDGGDDRVRVLRVGGVLYLLACCACLLVDTPMGSNVERYGVLLAGPLLLCALSAPRPMARPAPRPARRLVPHPAWRLVPAALALGTIVTWIVWGPVRETAAVAGSPATQASYYAPVKRFLLAHGGALERVEVPLTRSHWEAALLAGSVSLARGWEKQLEERYDSPLLEPGLTARSYERWLHQQAVSYVALPDVTLDPSSAREGALIRGGLPYLRLVLATRHWRVYAVRDATPLLEGPGRLTALGSDTFALDAHSAGTLEARIHYTRYFTVVSGEACVTSAPGGWTYVRARAPGRIVVSARFSVGRALGLSGSCPAAGGA